MNEIIQRLIEKTGLPEDQARMAVDTVVNFLKEKLPGPVAAQIDGLIAGDWGISGKAGEMATSLGGLFGSKE
jgi:nucleoid DNA-binding protein